MYEQPAAGAEAPAMVAAQLASERLPLADAVGHVPLLADQATAGMFKPLVELNAAPVVRFTLSLSAADVLPAA